MSLKFAQKFDKESDEYVFIHYKLFFYRDQLVGRGTTCNNQDRDFLKNNTYNFII